MKTLMLFFTLNIAYSQFHAVNESDIKNMTCQKSVIKKMSREAYVKKLKKEGVQTKSLLAFPKFKLIHFKDIDFAFNTFPKWMNLTKNTEHYNGIRVVYRYKGKKNGFDFKNLVANSFITIGPRWFESNSIMRRAILIHEIAHRISDKLNKLAHSKEWINASRAWEKAQIRGPHWHVEPKDSSLFVSDYAMTNPSEDWAESVSLYRVNPLKLMDISMSRYLFLKEKVFLGVEFFSEGQCIGKPLIKSNKKKIFDYVANHYDELKAFYKETRSFNKTVSLKLKNYSDKLFFENSKDLSFLSDTKFYRNFK